MNETARDRLCPYCNSVSGDKPVCPRCGNVFRKDWEKGA